MRLDALVLRAGFARTGQQARQVVVRHILVDGKDRRPPLLPREARVRPSRVKPEQTTVPFSCR